MKNISLNILRIGLAITFLWIGILILKDPEGWGAYLKPWAANLVFIPIKQAMIANGVLDIIISALLLLNLWTWVAALFGALHIFTVLVVSGINDITVRDIGLLAATISLVIETVPKSIATKIKL